MAPWLRFLEAYMVQLLLRTPAFHRAVEKVARGVHRFRHGIPPEEMGGTKIDDPSKGSFLRHFGEEIQAQLGRTEAKASDVAVKSEGSAVGRTAKNAMEEDAAKAEDESAEAVWRDAQKRDGEGEAQKQGFMGEYLNVLREQIRRGK